MANALFSDSFRRGAAGDSLVGTHPTPITTGDPGSAATYPALAYGSSNLTLDGTAGVSQPDGGSGGTDRQMVPVPGTFPTSGTVYFTLTNAANLAASDRFGVELADASGGFVTIQAFWNAQTVRVYIGGMPSESSASLSATAGGVNRLAAVFSSATSGTGTTTVDLYLFDANNSNPAHILSASGTGQPAITGLTIRSDNSSGAAGNVHLGDLSLTSATAQPPAAGAVSAPVTPATPLSVALNLSDLTVTSATSASVSVATPTGGSGSYTYQWYLSPTVNFTPSPATLVSSQTGPTATFTGLEPNSPQWAVGIVDDGNTTVTTFHRLVQISGIAPTRVLFIGDSTSAPNIQSPTFPAYINGQPGPPSRHFRTALQSWFGPHEIITINQAIPGTASADWTPNNPNNYLTTAIAAATAGGLVAGDWGVVRLGANDAQGHIEGTAYQTNVASTVGALVAAGLRVQLDYPTWREPGVFVENTALTFDEATTPYLTSYLPILDALVDNISVFAGDKISFATSGTKPTYYLNRSPADPGGIHETVDGAVAMGTASALALARNMALIPAATSATLAQIAQTVASLQAETVAQSQAIAAIQNQTANPFTTNQIAQLGQITTVLNLLNSWPHDALTTADADLVNSRLLARVGPLDALVAEGSGYYQLTPDNLSVRVMNYLKQEAFRFPAAGRTSVDYSFAGTT